MDSGLRVAVLVEDGFEDDELAVPVAHLRTAGAEIVLVAPFAGRQYRGKDGHIVTSGVAMGAARQLHLDALIVPGGYAPDRMRMRHALVDLVRDTFAAGRVLGAISHGPQLLISADVLRGRTVTCSPSIAVDVKNAGGLYVDRPVAEDGNLITSRKRDDAHVFSEAVLRALKRSR